MEQTAEIGVAAHWRYKENSQGSKNVDSHVKWLRELLDILHSEENDPKEFMHLLKIDLFSDEIFVFTPKGDLVQLPVKSTPLDFAFEVHSEVGKTCLGAKVNHKTVPLNTELQNGDTIEVITTPPTATKLWVVEICYYIKSQKSNKTISKKARERRECKNW